MSEPSLEELRKSIQSADSRIVELLNERATLALEIGRKKADLGMEIYDPLQEDQVYNRLAQYNNGPMPVSVLSAIFGQVVAASRSLQNTLMTALLPRHDRQGWGRVKVCIPVVGPGLDEAVGQIRAAAPVADLLELRLDLMEGAFLKELVREIRRNPFPVKIVVTHRRGEESGLPALESSLPEGERIAVLREAVLAGVDYVDVELRTEAGLRDSLKALIAEHRGPTQLILSCHNFQETPSAAVLEDLWRCCREGGAQVIKIVTLARTVADNLRLLRLIPWSLGKGQEIVAFCMGEPGKISRIMAPMLGAHFTFAALGPESATAPGQLTAAEMAKIFEILGGGPSAGHKDPGESAEGDPDRGAEGETGR